MPKRSHGTKTAITGEHCRHAVLDRVIFAIPAERVSPLVGDRAPSGIAIHASVAGAGVKTERGDHGGDGKCQFDGKDFHARQCTAATVRKANVRPAGLPRNRNKCQPKTAKDAPKMRPWGALSNFSLLLCSLFVLMSNSGNIPGILARYSMRRKAVKCLFRQHFPLYPRSKAEPPLWPNYTFCCLRIQGGPKPCMPSLLSILPHLIATCRMAALPAAHSMRLSRQRKRHSQPLSVFS